MGNNHRTAWNASSAIIKACQSAMIALLLSSCSGRKVDSDLPPEDPRDKKIDSMTSALSRAQSRIEELDAKLSAMADKVDSMRLTVDNLAGTGKALDTTAVGSAAKEEAPPADDIKKAASSEGKALLNMDAAIGEFSSSMNIFKSGKYGDAELAFSRFTEKYPEHILAGSAQFYAGESYFMMGEYKLALNEYGKVLSSFASSPRAATAMVRMAQCHTIAGNAAEASRAMTLARDLYAGNPSLDLPAPAFHKSEGKHEGPKDSLKASPIEPAAVPTPTGEPARASAGEENHAHH